MDSYNQSEDAEYYDEVGIMSDTDSSEESDIDKNNEEIPPSVKESEEVVKDNKEQIIEELVSTRLASNEVIIVKLPRYISEQWQNAPDEAEVAEIVFDTNDVGAVMSAQMPDLEENAEKGSKVRLKREFDRVDYTHPVGIFSYPLENGIDPVKENGQIHNLRMHAHFKTRYTIMPKLDKYYIKMKRANLNKLKPEPKLQFINDVSSIATVVQRPRAAKVGKSKTRKVKNMRGEKEEVMNMLFKAFESQKHYFLKDLVKETKQPIKFLKELLGEICVYNTTGKNKCMWQLKSEYCHY